MPTSNNSTGLRQRQQQPIGDSRELGPRPRVGDQASKINQEQGPFNLLKAQLRQLAVLPTDNPRCLEWPLYPLADRLM